MDYRNFENTRQPNNSSVSRANRYTHYHEGPPRNAHIRQNFTSESEGCPPNDFRTLSVYPTFEEILGSNDSYIRKNIIEGRYDNVDHYLDVHFRLLKEDFVAPLRQGIAEYIQQRKGTNHHNQKISGVTIHPNVVFRSWIFEKDREAVILTFSKKNSNESIFLPDSERFKHGSLVIFTKDFFGSVLFGKVLERDCENKQLIIGFELECHDLKLNVLYVMVECKTFFEPYYHVLKALQCKNQVNFPMKSYLIDVNAGVQPPGYLNGKSCVFAIQNRYLVDLFSNNWPTAAQLQLNLTQVSALKAALTQKFVIIQGPPGTGKTYLAVQIVNTLLYNSKFWYKQSPILIVCVTNHALDQFLERLMSTTTAIVRVGGQSKNEKLNQFNLKNLERNYTDRQLLRGLKAQIKNVLYQIEASIDELEKAKSNTLVILIRSVAITDVAIKSSWFYLASAEELQAWLPTVQWRKEFDVKINGGKHLTSKTPLHNIDYSSPHTMHSDDRSFLYFYWMNLNINSIKTKLASLRQQLNMLNNKYTESRNIIDANAMQNKLVIGMTTSGAARLQSTLEALRCPIVIVEEAAEVLESHVIVSLTKHCQHLILIGDHQQLRPSTADYRIEKEFNLGISMFERMVLNKIQCNVLGVQHRMRPEIAELIVPHIYPKLENHYSVTNFLPIVGIDSSVYFIHHDHHEKDAGESKSNLHEAKFLIHLACYLRKVGYKPEDITILSPYLGQKFALHDESKHFPELLKDVRISSVDNYQGEECKIILLSLVRNNRHGDIGFLKTENRICVALSRAKEGFYIMGNMDLLCKKSEVWKKIKEVLVKQNSIGNYLPVHCKIHRDNITKLKEPQDFVNLGIGSCLKICRNKLQCGHQCSKPCHVFYGDSTNACIDPCLRMKCIKGHIFTKSCSSKNDCPTCVWEKNELLNKCHKLLPCGHECPRSIFQACGGCYEMVWKILPLCGHSMPVRCGEIPNMKNCMGSYTKYLKCGHYCEVLCNESCKIKNLPVAVVQPWTWWSEIKSYLLYWYRKLTWQI